MEIKWIYGENNIDNCRNIREEVFVNEQGFSKDNEFDNMDAVSYHLEVSDSGKAVATARVFKEDALDGVYHCGRICVLKEYRKTGLGAVLMQEIKNKVESLNGKAVELSAQVRARGFYEKQGYVAYGEEYLDEYCPHIMMKIEI